MSEYFDKRIYVLDFVELKTRVLDDRLTDLLGYALPENAINFAALDGVIHGDYSSNDFFDITLDAAIDPAYLSTLSQAEQERLKADTSNVKIGLILPPAAIMDAIRYASPQNLLGDDHFVNTTREAKDLRTDYIPTAGNDIIYGDGTNNDVDGGDGDDFINAEGGADKVYGGNGNDFIIGIGEADLLIGGEGDDWLGGWDGNDILVGGNGNDWLEGGKDQDELYGNDGDDYLHGNIGNDYLSAGAGNDLVNGSEDDDVVIGGNGEDILIGGLGDDILIGEYYLEGEGWSYDYAADTFLYSYDFGNDTIRDFGYGDDILDVRNMGFANLDEFIALGEQIGDNIIFTFSDGGTLTFENLNLNELTADNVWIVNDKPVITIETSADITGTEGADTIQGTDLGETIYAGAENDTVYGLMGIDYIWGQAGDDYIEGNAGNDWLFGELGNDTLHGNRGRDHLYGQEGDDILFGDEAGDYLIGGEGADTLNGGVGHDVAAYYLQTEGITIDLLDRANDTGEAIGDTFISIEEFALTLHDDVFIGSNDHDRVAGLEGNDRLTGNGGDDDLFGDEGDDILTGGTGNDRIFTGAGSDTVVFFDNDGFDEVYQFNVAEDLLQFSVDGVSSIDDLVITDNGINTFVDYGTGTVMIHNIQIENISDSNFVFV